MGYLTSPLYSPILCDNGLMARKAPTFRVTYWHNADTGSVATEYRVHKTSKNNPRRESLGSLVVNHAQYHPNFLGTFDYHPVTSHWEGSRLVNHRPYGDTDTLFHEVKPQITNAAAHPEMAPHMALLMSMAHQQHGVMEVDSSLSRNSSRVARHARDMGLVVAPKENPDLRVTNDEDFSPTYKAKLKRVTKHTTELNTTEVMSARQHLRNILAAGKERKVHMSSQFDQHLPGMENI